MDAPISSREARRIYDGLSPYYGLIDWIEAPAKARAIAVASALAGEAALEVGLGTGQMLSRLLVASPRGRALGLDLSVGMLKRARRRLASFSPPSVGLVQGDARHLPFADGSFDLLINSYMIDLVPSVDIPRVLGEFRRVLRPGGHLVLLNMAPGRGMLERAFEQAHSWLYRRWPRQMGGCRAVEAAPLLEQAGFQVLHREHVVQPLMPTELTLSQRP